MTPILPSFVPRSARPGTTGLVIAASGRDNNVKQFRLCFGPSIAGNWTRTRAQKSVAGVSQAITAEDTEVSSHFGVFCLIHACKYAPSNYSPNDKDLEGRHVSANRGRELVPGVHM